MRHADTREWARRWFPFPHGRDATAFVRTGYWLGPRGAISPTLTPAQLHMLHIPGRCGRQLLPHRTLSVKILPVLRSFFPSKKKTAEARRLPPLISLYFYYFIFAGNSLQLLVATNNKPAILEIYFQVATDSSFWMRRGRCRIRAMFLFCIAEILPPCGRQNDGCGRGLVYPCGKTDLTVKSQHLA